MLRPRPARRRRWLASCLLSAAYLLTTRPAAAWAQDPSAAYFSIVTLHFRVTFTKPLEPLARRVAANAERAYTQLSNDLHAPRGPIDILVSDAADFSNGSATPIPSNRIVVYATPPINESALRFTTDWAQLVVTHELTHIFHLDRSRGLWRLAQHVFGRSPFLFPNSYSPSWLIEGLAVYEESRLAGEGRIEAPEHTMLARTAAADHKFPTIGQASLALSTFPLGNASYAYGSLFIDYLARTRGDSTIRKFIESASVWPPYVIDIPARRAFGVTFTSAWGGWRTSVEAAANSTPLEGGTAGGRADGWRELTGDGLAVSFPRWSGDSSLTYTGTGGKDAYGAYTVSLDGTRQRLSRRNSPSPTVKLADGGMVFSQLELTGPYAERSDLFVQRGRRQVRLTTNARLFSPDTRTDGAIVATQIVDGASRLVRVSTDGETIAPITAAALDTLWSEPRWSHKGDRIVAARWFRGGVSQIVVLDTLGIVEHIATSGRFTAASPSWLPIDRGIAYTIGENARNDVFLQYFFDSADLRAVDSRGDFPGPSYKTLTYKVSRSDLGAFEPQVASGSAADRLRIAAVSLRADGYHLGVTDGRSELQQLAVQSAPVLDLTPDPRLPALAVDSSPAAKYSALSTLFPGWALLPSYWVPLIESGIDADTYRLGGYTELWDLLRRHYLFGQLLIPTDSSGIAAAAEYQYKGLGMPIVTVDASQNWARYATIVSKSTGATLGKVRRRTRDGSVLATFLRQRVRSAFTLSAGAGIERREYVSVPGSLLAVVDPTNQLATADVPRVTLSTSYATYRSPPFSISPEDGFGVSATVRERFKSGFSATGGATTSLVGSLIGYKSFDLPGYAHHVLAVRGAAGLADTKAGGYYEVGGTSGGSFELVPGYTVGEGRQTFGVRGFQPATLIGIRALGASAEYRAPLFLAHHSIGVLPAFLNRSSITFFGDYGVAWCPNTVPNRQVCAAPSLEQKVDITSVGAELNVNAGVFSWDSPSRFRLGVAHPMQNGAAFAAKAWSVYLTSGVSF